VSGEWANDDLLFCVEPSGFYPLFVVDETTSELLLSWNEVLNSFSIHSFSMS
jgi:hypothetical protein